MEFRKFLEQNTIGKHNDFATAAYTYHQGSTNQGTGHTPTLGDWFVEPKNIQFNTTPIEIEGKITNISPRSANQLIQRRQDIFVQNYKDNKVYRISLSREELERWTKLGYQPEIGKKIKITMNRDGKIQAVS